MSEEVRSVQRALQIMRIMNERETWSLHELSGRVGLAKSTLHRLLATLEAEQIVRPGATQYGHYQLTSEARQLSKGVTDTTRLIEVARPLLQEATQSLKWPLTLAVIHQARSMLVVACGMPYSPYAIRPSSLGRQYDLVHSALGRAYLAFCSPTERRILVEALSRQEGEAPRWDDKWALRAMVMKTRSQGYALRQATSETETTAFAVPVFGQGVLRGALVFSTYAGQYDATTIDRYLPRVRQTANAIGAAADASDLLTIDDRLLRAQSK